MTEEMKSTKKYFLSTVTLMKDAYEIINCELNVTFIFLQRLINIILGLGDFKFAVYKNNKNNRHLSCS